ncbi:HNH endonuclease [Streptococcus varani]|uniref:Putative HNH nuclease YajD n=1 Tax=Streptococcus varani TaxID=1608583 RepID=A0A0E4CSI7_9STRE|nr:HNH endonuclease signature motif containing protein [Streptococcus varani]CQR24589.1 HNH endonuclease [Streptococcus varani]
MIDVSSRESRRQFYTSTAWRKLRRKVLIRDHFECQWCAAEGKVTMSDQSILEVDHIKELEHYPEFALDIDNLRTLCKEHHNQRHERFEFRKKGKSKKKDYRDDEWWG